jgi:hypothetical protein
LFLSTQKVNEADILSQKKMLKKLLYIVHFILRTLADSIIQSLTELKHSIFILYYVGGRFLSVAHALPTVFLHANFADFRVRSEVGKP